MELLFTFDVDNDLIRAALSGRFSLPDAKTTFMGILDACENHRAKKVLIDCRAVSGDPKTTERFYYGKFVAKAAASLNARGVSHEPQFAYVMEEPLLDRHRFGETVALNRGMRVRVFESLDDAEDWLQVTPSPAAPQSQNS